MRAPGCWRVVGECRGACALAYYPTRREARRRAAQLRRAGWRVAAVARCTDEHA